MDIVHSMNYNDDITASHNVTQPQVRRFQELVDKLFEEKVI